MFPSVRFRVRERSRHKSALVMQKYSRQQAREQSRKPVRTGALVAQAEIELAFHSPETVGSWHARWSDRVAEHDRKPCSGSGASVFRHWPEWNAGSGRICHSGGVIAEAGMAARVVGHAVREMERWMVPNKLRE
ncbi:plasmid SOS inhibition protein A, partial [Escherichia coli]|uniref:plasmid SOS inhibition protein A n=1 Tax=Escherichia coli TaxID=562 RepID=UPI001915A2C5